MAATRKRHKSALMGDIERVAVMSLDFSLIGRLDFKLSGIWADDSSQLGRHGQDVRFRDAS